MTPKKKEHKFMRFAFVKKKQQPAWGWMLEPSANNIMLISTFLPSTSGAIRRALHTEKMSIFIFHHKRFFSFSILHTQTLGD